MKVRKIHQKRYEHVGEYYNSIRRDFEHGLLKCYMLSDKDVHETIQWFLSELGGDEITELTKE